MTDTTNALRALVEAAVCEVLYEDGFYPREETITAAARRIAALATAQPEAIPTTPGYFVNPSDPSSFQPIKPEAKGEVVVGWYDAEHGDFSRVERLGWVPLYARQAQGGGEVGISVTATYGPKPRTPPEVFVIARPPEDTER